MVVGSPGSGKTTLLELLIRQDISQGHGFCLIDPQGALADRVAYACAYRRRPFVFLDCSAPTLAGFNPFRRTTGDITAQVDRRVLALLKAWGAKSGDETPRLEKWLRCLFTLAITHSLTIHEAGLALRHPEFRASLAAKLPDSIVRFVIRDLENTSHKEFQNQVESTVNRLLRFEADSTPGLVLGTDSIDIPSLMERSGALVVKLPLGPHLSEIQQRTIGILLVNELYEAAMARRRGAVPFYFYIDEASLFATPELGKALDHCRQKGLHITFAFQHLWQFRAEDASLYHSVKNSARTKVVFRVDSRPDASELADDIVPGLAVPEVKDEIYGLSHKVIDTYLPTISSIKAFSMTDGRSSGKSWTSSTVEAKHLSYGFGQSSGEHESPAGDLLPFSGSSSSETYGKTDSESESESESTGASTSETSGSSLAISFAPATRHEPFVELRSRTFYTLEERRWRAAEEVMTLDRGQALVRLPNGSLERVAVPRPKPLLREDEAVQFLQGTLASYPTRAEIRAAIAERHQKLLAAPEDFRAPARKPTRRR